MDDIIQIVVFFFIIYSILAPLLGKRKSQKVNKKVPPKYREDVRKERASSRLSSNDILEDILGFKIPKTENEYSTSSPENRSENYDLKTVDYDTDLKVDYKNLETSSKMPNVDYDKLPFMESIKTAESQPALVLDSSLKLNERATFLKYRIADKVELRDIFLIKEILDKPKALRR
jgi:hypothetical protein